MGGVSSLGEERDNHGLFYLDFFPKVELHFQEEKAQGGVGQAVGRHLPLHGCVPVQVEASHGHLFEARERAGGVVRQVAMRRDQNFGEDGNTRPLE